MITKFLNRDSVVIPECAITKTQAELTSRSCFYRALQESNVKVLVFEDESTGKQDFYACTPV